MVNHWALEQGAAIGFDALTAAGILVSGSVNRAPLNFFDLSPSLLYEAADFVAIFVTRLLLVISIVQAASLQTRMEKTTFMHMPTKLSMKRGTSKTFSLAKLKATLCSMEREEPVWSSSPQSSMVARNPVLPIEEVCRTKKLPTVAEARSSIGSQLLSGLMSLYVCSEEVPPVPAIPSIYRYQRAVTEGDNSPEPSLRSYHSQTSTNPGVAPAWSGFNHSSSLGVRERIAFFEDRIASPALAHGIRPGSPSVTHGRGIGLALSHSPPPGSIFSPGRSSILSTYSLHLNPRLMFLQLVTKKPLLPQTPTQLPLSLLQTITTVR
ncbi:hypothetical protein FS842_001691 [Serendipita sp. 407]|nr:hypothetical protein FS842_001691 [Serendipita sp. 407]